MPYRRGRKRTRATRRAGTKLNSRQKTQVKRLIRNTQEVKFTSLVLAGTGFSNTPTTVRLSEITQGVSDQQRTGDTVSLSHILFRAHFACGDQFNTCRIIIYQWKPMETGFPLDSDILLPGPTGASDILSQIQQDTRSMFTILWDHVFRLTGEGTTTSPIGPKTTYYITKTIYPKRKTLQFRAGSSTIMAGGIYAILVADSGLTPHPQVSFSAKVMFTDS